jgi:hypothetical protein
MVWSVWKFWKFSIYMRNHFCIFTESVDPDTFGLFSKYRWIGIRHNKIFFTVYYPLGQTYLIWQGNLSEKLSRKCFPPKIPLSLKIQNQKVLRIAWFGEKNVHNLLTLPPKDFCSCWCGAEQRVMLAQTREPEIAKLFEPGASSSKTPRHWDSSARLQKILEWSFSSGLLWFH